MEQQERHGTPPHDYDQMAHTWQALRETGDQAAIDALLDPLTDADWRHLMERMEAHYPLDPMQRHMEPFKALDRMKAMDGTPQDDAVFLAQMFASTCPYGGCPVCRDFLQQYPPPDYMEQQPAR